MPIQTDLRATPGPLDFSALHQAMQRYVDQDLLAGVSSAVLVGQDLVDLHCAGWADKESQTPLDASHLFRIFSSTKLVTTIGVLLLMEEGLLQLDDPVANTLPALRDLRVLRPGAATIDDVEPARKPITIRHLLTHQSGLSYGLLDPGTLMFNAYRERRILSPRNTLAQMVEALAGLPLLFQPGEGWEYSVGIDVAGHVIEQVSGQPLDAFLKARIFEPLGMHDTAFVVPSAQQHRLAAYYMGADFTKPMKPGLSRNDNAPYPQANLRPTPWLSGGGGLVSSLGDSLALMRSLLPGGPALLKPATLAMMMGNQLPSGQWIRFPRFGEVVGKGHGLGGAVTLMPSPFDPAGSTGEFQWGGLAGTHWWINPQANIAGVVMTQRDMAFWHPFSFEFKQLVYQALGV
jgi:CubicO group peptidase (beta-lactamase class C family)